MEVIIMYMASIKPTEMPSLAISNGILYPTTMGYTAEKR